MKRRRQQRSNLGLERLEDRQMMATDLMPPPAPLDVLPHENSSPALASDLAAASRTAPRPRDTVIPIAAAEPRSYDGTGNNLANP